MHCNVNEQPRSARGEELRFIPYDMACRTVYDAVESNLATGGPLRAALFWKWTGVGELRDEQGVLRADTAFQCG